MRATMMVVVTMLTAQAAQAAPRGFAPGEGLTFSLTVGPIEAGRARMSVGQPERLDGKRLAQVHGEAHSAAWLRLFARLDDEYRVVFDADALTPTKVVSVETGVRERRIESALDGAQLAIDFVSPEEKYHAARRLPGVARDPMTALFALRAAPLTDGEVVPLLVLDGPALYRATARVSGREKLIGTIVGDVSAIRVEIEAVRIDDGARTVQGWDARRITMWVSDDDRRLPLRIAGDTDLGRAQVELTSATLAPWCVLTKPDR